MINSEMFKLVGNTISTLSIIIGITLSVLNFRIAKEKEAESRKIEAAKPFLELRQKLYLEALTNASILASQDFHTEEEVRKAKQRFAELYWGELSLIEEKNIEKAMIQVADSMNLNDSISPSKRATYNLAHSMRESLVNSWGIDRSKIGEINP
ncbi:hypothetical protein [Flavobacterium sp. JAS]|uniref:hypothetical protein n=1 Tax=Flavobacterium sp. JAS TaxID=2897329 RepID=UPI001E501FC9|nr:hypothetical protein [Flavobacterium sp. JAS]MCD0470735.1 hypothetical protein [Flavobacterium sp. JAS]